MNTGHWTRRRGRARYCIDGTEQTEPVFQMPYGRLMGDHTFPGSKDPATALYVFRDGRDVACSVWNWSKFRRKDDESMSLIEFLQAPIDWRGSPGHRMAPKDNYTIFDHWRDHVSAWAASGALLVRYERLIADPGAVIARIARRFSLDVLEAAELPSAVGWNPSDGKPKVGNWRSDMSEEGQRLFDAKVRASHPGRWGDL